MVKGDDAVLGNIRLGRQATVAELIKELGQVSPLALLQLVYGHKTFDFPGHLLQHADDLNFLQDTLSAAAGSSELNPMVNAVLASFNRRRRYQRFKIGQCNLDLDKIKFAKTATEQDEDARATTPKTRDKSTTTPESKNPRAKAHRRSAYSSKGMGVVGAERASICTSA